MNQNLGMLFFSTIGLGILTVYGLVSCINGGASIIYVIIPGALLAFSAYVLITKMKK